MTPSLSRLRELLAYDSGAGILRWRVARGNVRAGAQTGRSTDARDYPEVRIDGRLYKVHTIVFYMYHEWLPEEIDHFDKDVSNFKISNLRPCTRSLNCAYRDMPENVSGFRGVSWHKRTAKWRAQITVKGKVMHLGYFETAAEGAKAYDEAAAANFGQFAMLNYV